MENIDYDDIKSRGNVVNMGNSNVLWSIYITTTSQPPLSFVSDSAGIVRNGSNTTTGGGGSGSVFESDLIIPLYVVIFVLAIVGNSLVLITLAQNKRMRTVTNVYLLNLVSHSTFVIFYVICFILVSSFTLVTFYDILNQASSFILVTFLFMICLIY